MKHRTRRLSSQGHSTTGAVAEICHAALPPEQSAGRFESAYDAFFVWTFLFPLAPRFLRFVGCNGSHRQRVVHYVFPNHRQITTLHGVAKRDWTSARTAYRADARGI